MKDKAIHKALKVLNCLNNNRVYETAWVKGAINACEEALEQPAQEPVAWMGNYEHTSSLAFQKEALKDAKEIKPLYTHPHQWQGLTDDEIEQAILSKNKAGEWWGMCLDIARAIEAKLKEKNHD